MRTNTIFIEVEADDVGRAIRVTTVLEDLPLSVRQKIHHIEDGEGCLRVDVRERISAEEAELLREAWENQNEPTLYVLFKGECLFDFPQNPAQAS